MQKLSRYQISKILILLLLSILWISLSGRGENEVSVGRSSFKLAFLSQKNTFQTCWNFLNNFHDIYINIKGLFSSKYQGCKTRFKLWWPYCGTMTSIFVYLQYDILRTKLSKIWIWKLKCTNSLVFVSLKTLVKSLLQQGKNQVFCKFYPLLKGYKITSSVALNLCL